MSKLDSENSLVEPNGSFSESVSTTFVHDCWLFGDACKQTGNRENVSTKKMLFEITEERRQKAFVLLKRVNTFVHD